VKSATKLYDIIADRFGFNIPMEYREFHSRGWLTLDRPARQVTTIPGDGYLYIADMEWYTLEEIAEFQFPDYCMPVRLGLVPFAFTGGGDFWCWQIDSEGPRVLLCHRDDTDATIYSGSFHGAIYRAALHYACSWVNAQSANFPEERSFIRRWASDFRLVCPPDWCDTLAGIAERSPVQWSMHKLIFNSLLLPQEKKEIEEKYLQFPEIDTEIGWMNP
jgi:hypothetical protein